MLYVMIYWITSKHGVSCNCTIGFCLGDSWYFDRGRVRYSDPFVHCETGVVIMSAQLEMVMIVQVILTRWSKYMCMFCLSSE